MGWKRIRIPIRQNPEFAFQRMPFHVLWRAKPKYPLPLYFSLKVFERKTLGLDLYGVRAL